MVRAAASIWSALPAYIGGKRRLAPLIFRELDRVFPRRLWGGARFVDAFAGGGSVSLFAKAQGFLHVHAIDIAERSVIVGRALIANGRVHLTEADLLRIAGTEIRTPGPIETLHVPSVFPANVAQFLDRALATAEATADGAKANLIKLLAMKLAMAAHPMAQVRPGTAHRVATGELEAITESCVKVYIDAKRLTSPAKLRAFIRAINGGVIAGEGDVTKGSAIDVLPTLKADVVYCDPPYAGTTSYEREFKVIDAIFDDGPKPVSRFSQSVELLDALFDSAVHIPVWLLSYGNAELSGAELQDRVAACGRETRLVEVPYAHKASVARAETRARNRELLVVAVDPEHRLIQRIRERRAVDAFES